MEDEDAHSALSRASAGTLLEAVIKSGNTHLLPLMIMAALAAVIAGFLMSDDRQRKLANKFMHEMTKIGSAQLLAEFVALPDPLFRAVERLRGDELSFEDRETLRACLQAAFA